MRLKRLHASGFRALNDIEVNFDSLTILIGENDAGKSSILDIIEIFLDPKKYPDSDDFRQKYDGSQVSKIEIELSFDLEKEDIGAQPYALNDILRVKKTYFFDGDPAEVLYWTEVPEDPKLRGGFSQLSNAQAEKDFLTQLDPSISDDSLKNGPKRKEWYDAFCDAAPKIADWIEMPKQLIQLLPRFERYSALEYNAPEQLVHRTLRQVFEQMIYEQDQDGTSTNELIAPLQKLQRKAKHQLEEKIKELKEDIQRYNTRIHNIGYEPTFDFTSSLRGGNFQVDFGLGSRVLAKTGAGTKRCMLMAITEWDRRINLEQAQTSASLPSIIRGYDEPDTNLHYEAQRTMYQAISDIARSKDSRIQAILCTHSITMIDRAPAQSIRLLRLNEKGATIVEQIQTNENDEIKVFLEDLARELGITNSSIFYEKCFILVEGETEENALPIFYKRIYQSNLSEDGIRIINLKGNGGARPFLQLLSRNRQELTIVFVDSDSRLSNVGKLTENVLRETGFDDAFINERVIYVGNQEFEDGFPNDVICECLNTTWPKGQDQWKAADIDQLRQQAKFSNSLKDEVYQSGRPDIRSSWSKPNFGLSMARICPLDKIPGSVVDLFELARRVAKIQETQEEIDRRRAFLRPNAI